MQTLEQNIYDLLIYFGLSGRSHTMLTRFWLFLTTYPPALTFSTLQTLTNTRHFWTTYLKVPISSCKWCSLWTPPYGCWGQSEVNQWRTAGLEYVMSTPSCHFECFASIELNKKFLFYIRWFSLSALSQLTLRSLGSTTGGRSVRPLAR